MAQGSRAEKASTPSRSGASRAEAIDVEELLAQQQHRTGTSSGSTSRAGRSGGAANQPISLLDDSSDEDVLDFGFSASYSSSRVPNNESTGRKGKARDSPASSSRSPALPWAHIRYQGSPLAGRSGSRTRPVNVDEHRYGERGRNNVDEEIAGVGDVRIVTLTTDVVGVRYYAGLVAIAEAVRLQREPGNRFDRNAVQVMNSMNQQIGHLPAGVSAQLAPLLDARLVRTEAYMRAGNINRAKPFTLGIGIDILGRLEQLPDLRRRLLWATPMQRGFDAETERMPSAAMHAANARREAEHWRITGQLASTGTTSETELSWPAVLDYNFASQMAGPSSVFGERPGQPPAAAAAGMPGGWPGLPPVAGSIPGGWPGEPLAAGGMPDDWPGQPQGQPMGEGLSEVLHSMASSAFRGPDALTSLYGSEADTDVAQLPLHPNPDGWKKRGLRAQLHPHQSQGVAWMTRAEHPVLPDKPEEKPVALWVARKDSAGRTFYQNLATGSPTREPPPLPRGGILSDAMGLGKTLQVIALSLSDESGSDVLGAKAKKKGAKNSNLAAGTSLDAMWAPATLIVCPLSVLYNWSSQIKQHTDPSKVKFFIYHADTAKNVSSSELAKYDFVITTYDTLKSEFGGIEQTRAEEEVEKRRQADLDFLTAELGRARAEGRKQDAERIEPLLKASMGDKKEEKGASPAKKRAKPNLPLKGKPSAQPKTEVKRDNAADDDEYAEEDESDTEEDDDGTFTSKGSRSKGKAKRSTTNGKRKKTSKASECTLFKTRWRRVVLDEAHTIRNPKTTVFRACMELEAERRWAISGTVIVNSTKDLGALCRFVRLAPLNEPTLWSQLIERAIKRGQASGAMLLKAVVSALILRRTKDMTDAKGKALIELPPIDFYKHTIDLDDDTRSYYDEVAEALRNRVAGYINDGVLAQRYSNVLVFLSRLRQIACHRDLCPPNFLEDLRKLEVPTQTAGGAAQLDPEALAKLQETLKSFVEMGEECPICYDGLKDPRITTCAHCFCKACIEAAIEAQKKCPMDRNPLSLTSLIELPPEPVQTESKVVTPVPDAKEAAISQSAKINELARFLHATERTDPTVKSLVFSNYVAFLDKIAVVLKTEGIPFVRFDGSMNKKRRDAVLESFARPIGADETEDEEQGMGDADELSRPLSSKSKGKSKAQERDYSDGKANPRVMLISIQSGALGLNLTSASQVFLMDPWWQSSVEAQAIDRVHRIGQTRSVKVFQMIAAGTIEQRVLEIQERKEELIRGAFSHIKNRGTAAEQQRQKHDTRLRDLAEIFGLGRAAVAAASAGA